MSLQKAGADLDNDIANIVEEKTADGVKAHSMRGSGNLRTPQPDVLIRTPKGDHAAELKKASWDTGTRRQIADQEDIEQLGECANLYTRIWFGVSMSNRELMFVGPLDPNNVGESLEAQIPDAFEPSYTKSGYLRLTKPSADDWPSSQSGDDDVDIILEALGLS